MKNKYYPGSLLLTPTTGTLTTKNSMGKLFERYELAEEFNNGNHAILYRCVRRGISNRLI
jgi:hypothetical protein